MAQPSVSLIIRTRRRAQRHPRETNWEWLRARWKPSAPMGNHRRPLPRRPLVQSRSCQQRRPLRHRRRLGHLRRRPLGRIVAHLKEAAELATTHPGSSPSRQRHRLNTDTTNHHRRQRPRPSVDWPTARSALDLTSRNANPYRLFPGGIFALTPDTCDRAGGFDPGSSDGAARTPHSGGRSTPRRPTPASRRPCGHLRHPKSKQADKIGRPTGVNERLNRRRYLAANGDREAMQRLISDRRS